ncbi:hypothetical protein BDN72DRAFT_843888 [Pluteus cervinus]|uniref:Uncharacterized protein n=1 Tax=Pluteus cervinus TaxID=181527 RepID=A0ACD3AP33_9AGAR|nr:hypothetical protein BDN72DRAFT_843888 [Pluteus cervinus]
MGSAQSYLTPENAVTAAVVVAGAVGIGYNQQRQNAPEPTAGGKREPSSTAGTGGDSKKKKKKSASSPDAPPTNQATVAPPPTSIPGQFEPNPAPEALGVSDDAPGGASTTSGKKGKKKAKNPGVGGATSVESSTVALPLPAPSSTSTPGGFDGPLSGSVDSTAPSSKSKKSKKKKPTKSPGDSSLLQSGGGSGGLKPPPSGVEGADPSSGYPSDSSTGAHAQSHSAAGALRRSQQISTTSSSSSARLSKPLQQSTMSIDTDGSWTHVGTRGQRGASGTGGTGRGGGAGGLSAGEGGLSAFSAASDVGAITSTTGNSSPVAERTDEDEDGSTKPLAFLTRPTNDNQSKKTLAERLLPKPRKTAVDDMLETPDYPSLARVMRVKPLPNEKPAQGFSWGDYEDVEVAGSSGLGGAGSGVEGGDADGEDDGGWGVVRSRKPKLDRSITQTPSGTPSTQSPSDSQTLNKKQRQRQQRREAQKAGKADAEAERLATLAKHKRELEKVRMAEQQEAKKSGKGVSGGMNATVDENGRLVWQ